MRVRAINNGLAMTSDSLSLSDELDALAEDTNNLSRAANDAGPERCQLELLLQHVLTHTGGDYACVLSLVGGSAYIEQTIMLSAAAERATDGKVRACHDTLAHTRPDPMTLSVMRLRRGICGKPTDIGLPGCLPGSHPPIRLFFMLPVESGQSHTSVMFVANPKGVERLHRDHELMREVEALIATVTHHTTETATPLVDTKNIIDPELGVRNYIQLMTASINAVVITNSKGIITAFNPSAESVFGRASENAIGSSLEQHLPPEFLVPVIKRSLSFENPPNAGDILPIKRRPVAAKVNGGDLLHLTCSAYFSRVDDEVFTTFVFEPESETAHSYASNSSHHQFKTLTNVAPVGIVQLGADWTCDYANEMWCQLSGLTMDETLAEGWVDGIHAEDVVDTLVELRETLSKNKIFSRNIRLQKPTGTICWVTLSATITLSEAGVFDGCMLVLLDVTEAHLASEKLRYTASHDGLTGLANRAAFHELLQNRLKSADTRRQTALLYLDLDGFKVVNDTLGHDCGDELLREVARRLVNSVATVDLCARLGGDEFTIILSSISEKEAICEMAETIVRNFNEPFCVFDNELSLSTSIGIAIADESNVNCDKLIKQADTALYKAKSSGRSRWVVYSREIEREDIQLSLLQARIHRATERKEFSLVYQPQYRIDDGSIVGFEALLRWYPTDIKVPDTQTLVEVLEESGLMNDVGQWVLESACQQYRRWEVSGLLAPGCTMSVNVSPAQLALANFPSRLKVMLQRCNMEATSLTLEITESALIEKNSRCIPAINQVKAMGVRIGLDDFGTGYASLSYLTRLPIDYLKIDKSFVMAMHTDESSRNIVMSVLALARTMNLSVVAEGIENQSTLDALKQGRCDYAQGFMYCKPGSPEALELVLIRDTLRRQEPLELG